jgi:hypothetical protein
VHGELPGGGAVVTGLFSFFFARKTSYRIFSVMKWNFLYEVFAKQKERKEARKYYYRTYRARSQYTTGEANSKGNGFVRQSGAKRAAPRRDNLGNAFPIFQTRRL